MREWCELNKVNLIPMKNGDEVLAKMTPLDGGKGIKIFTMVFKESNSSWKISVMTGRAGEQEKTLKFYVEDDSGMDPEKAADLALSIMENIKSIPERKNEDGRTGKDHVSTH